MKDRNSRSLIKAVSWRIIGTMDTIILSFLFLGDWTKAFSIGITEIFTKIILYYLHERIWNKFQWGRYTDKPQNRRSLFKSVTWRVVGTIDTMLISLFYSRDLTASALIGGTETFTKIALFYLHERLWAIIRWGRYDLGRKPVEE